MKTKTYDTIDEAAKDVTEKKRRTPPMAGNNGFSPIIGENGIHTKPGDNSRYAMQLLDMARANEILGIAFDRPDITIDELAELRFCPVNKNSIATMARRFIGYMAYCALTDTRITNTAAYLSMGISKDDAYNWEHERARGEEHYLFAKTIKGFCSVAREQLAADGKLSPVTLIWWQKNYDGYVDNNVVTVVNGGTKPEEPDKEAIAAKYVESLPIIDVPVNEVKTE